MYCHTHRLHVGGIKMDEWEKELSVKWRPSFSLSWKKVVLYLLMSSLPASLSSVHLHLHSVKVFVFLLKKNKHW